MGYAIHLEKVDGSISESELLKAVELITSIRVCENSTVAKNPITGEVIEISNGDVSLQIAFEEPRLFGLLKKVNWITCLNYYNGRVSFKATKDIEIETSPLRIAVRQLADVFSAKIVGDEGEEYHW